MVGWDKTAWIGFTWDCNPIVYTSSVSCTSYKYFSNFCSLELKLTVEGGPWGPGGPVGPVGPGLFFTLISYFVLSGQFVTQVLVAVLFTVHVFGASFPKLHVILFVLGVVGLAEFGQVVHVLFCCSV